MKILILMMALALSAAAETTFTWNVYDTTVLKAMGVPGIPPGAFDGVAVMPKWERDVSRDMCDGSATLAILRLDVGFVPCQQKPTAFVVSVEFEDALPVTTLAPIAPDAPCACSVVVVPFPKIAKTQMPKRVTVRAVTVSQTESAVVQPPEKKEEK